MTLEAVAEINGKRFFWAELCSGQIEFSHAGAPTAFIACLLLCTDWSRHDSFELNRLIAKLVANGAVFLGFWGLGSERLHNIAEDLLMKETPEAGQLPIPVSWEDEEKIEDELFHFVFSYETDAQYQSDCSWVVLSVDGDISRGEIERVFNCLATQR